MNNKTNRKTFARAALLLGGALALAACTMHAAPPPAAAPTPAPAPAAAPPPAPAPMARNDYSDPKTWLCLPGQSDACGAAKEDTTVIAANGTTKLEPFKPAKAPKIDCFYVYPTVSRDPGVLSDMNPGPEELLVVQAQFARFATKCRTFAPIYRQFTLTALAARQLGKPMDMKGIDLKTGYNDVVDAWNYYLAHWNKGRGVVLVGHSQGSGVLIQVIKNEIDGKPIQKQVISAILMGTRLAVPKTGPGVGGDFKTMPTCTAAKQTGCVIAYASFRETSPPPADTLFGKVQDPAMKAACVNPAALSGNSWLHSYFNTGASIVTTDADTHGFQWVKGKRIDTAFVSTPGLLTASCGANANGTYLGVTIHPANGPRTNDIRGDVAVGGQLLKQWGLHLIDANLFMGNLLDIVGKETKTYLAGK